MGTTHFDVKPSPARLRALGILAGCPDPHLGMSANQFAFKYYAGTKNEYLLSAVSNQGEGSCTGKKAWLCAGSLLSRMAKDGLVRRYITRDGHIRYSISYKGEMLLGNKN